MKRLSTIKNIVREMDENLKDENSEEFMAATTLLSSAINGLKSLKELAAFTKYSASFLKMCLKNLKDNGLGWRRGKFGHSGWFDEETGGVSFWLDVCVATGMIKAVK